jgi:hypothetical protein
MIRKRKCWHELAPIRAVAADPARHLGELRICRPGSFIAVAPCAMPRRIAIAPRADGGRRSATIGDDRIALRLDFAAAKPYVPAAFGTHRN